MAKFFIDRPVFAWVIALFIIVAGGVAITQLPIAQYPPVAPPAIIVSAVYPGASAKTLEDSVLSVIEQEMNGSPGMIFMESVAQANGAGNITLSFQHGTNADLAQVDVQNRLARATPRLPAAVTQQGVRVDKSRSNFLLFTILSSDNPAVDAGDAGRLRLARRAAGDPAHSRRRPGPAVRHRARHAHLDRPGQAGQLRPLDGRGQRRHPRPERAGVRRRDRRPAQRRRPGHRRDRGGQGPADLGRAVRRHRAARQHRRLHRAAQGRRAHRAGRPELRHVGPPERQAFHRHRRAAVAQRQRAGHGRRGAQAHGRAGAVLPGGREVGHPLRQLALHQDLDHRRWS